MSHKVTTSSYSRSFERPKWVSLLRQDREPGEERHKAEADLSNWIKLKNCEKKNVNQKKKIKNRISVLPKGAETAKQDGKYMIIILQCSPSSLLASNEAGPTMQIWQKQIRYLKSLKGSTQSKNEGLKNSG